MIESVDCQKALTLMSAAVDGELNAETRDAFLAHIAVCDDCRTEYEAEQATKAVLKSRLKRVKAPQSLVDAIRRQTGGAPDTANVQAFSRTPQIVLDHNSLAGQPKWKLALFRVLFIDPNLDSRSNTLFAFGLAFCIMGMLIFAGFVHERSHGAIDGTTLHIEHRAASNIFEMTTMSFAAAETGVKSDYLQSSDAAVLTNYLGKSLSLTPFVPVVKDYKAVSVRLTAFGHTNAGEILYRHTSNPKRMLSVYVSNYADVAHESCIPETAMERITQDARAFYSNLCPNGKQVAIWKWGDALYTATADDTALDLATVIRNPNW